MVEEDGFISDVNERRGSGRVQTELDQERREERERDHGREERGRERAGGPREEPGFKRPREYKPEMGYIGIRSWGSWAVEV